jgi:GH43 family beta-xylosidase
VIGRLRRLASGRLGRTPGVPPVAASASDEGRPSEDADLPAGYFVNPIAEGADPCVVRDGDAYLWCQSEGNVAIAIWVSDRLHSFGRKHVVWRAPAQRPYSKEVWAPELFKLDGRWHIYFAASDGRNRNHLSYVLVARTEDPLGPYDLHGPLFTGEASSDGSGVENLWSIDLTVLEVAGVRYAVWSGWPTRRDDLQHLYIAEMASPTELIGPRVRIAEAGFYDWERIHEAADSRGLHEAPQVLAHGGRTFVVYSCAASWLPTYKLGMLELTGTDPLDPRSWTRFPQPVFTASTTTYGVGHGSFVTSPDGRQWWHVFHAKVDPRDGWRRAVHVQPMSWAGDGTPVLGPALAARQPLEVPTGSPRVARSGAQTWDLTGPDGFADFDYYGHHQFFAETPQGVNLGITPKAPINAYRSGEKAVLRDGAYGDVRVTARFRFLEDHRAAGVLFRCSAVAVGYDAQRGYFAGIARDRGVLVLGRTDGTTFTLLGEAPLDVDPDASQTVTVTASGPDLRVTSGSARLHVRDDCYAVGTVGIRVVDTATCLTSLEVAPQT